MEIKEFAKQVADKIRDPAYWTRGTSARDKDGFGVNPDDPLAVQWCALGAADAINFARSDSLCNEFVAKYGRGLIYTNDKLGHDVIVRDLDNL